MVTTRGQKALAVPVIEVKPKTRSVTKTPKNVAPSKATTASLIDKSRIRGRKRPISENAISPTRRQSKRHNQRQTASPLPNAQEDECSGSELALHSSPTLEPLPKTLPTSDINSDELVASLEDPPISEIAPSDSNSTETSPLATLASDAPLYDVAVSEAWLSEDENASPLGSCGIEGHIPRLTYHDTITEADTEPHETSITLKTTELPHLEGMAMIVLHKIAKASASDIIAMITRPASTIYQEFDNTIVEFVKLRWLYSRRQILLDASELGFLLSDHGIAIRRANLASYLSAFLGRQDLGLHDLDEHFLSILVSGADMTKDTQNVFLDLKSQAFIAGLEASEAAEDLLEELFGNRFHKQLDTLSNGESVHLSEATKFITRCERRRMYLRKFASTDEGLAHVKNKFEWEPFLIRLVQWTKNNFRILTGRTFDDQDKIVHDPLISSDVIKPAEAQAMASSNEVKKSKETNIENVSNKDEIAEKAARAASLIMQDFSNPQLVATSSQSYQRIQFQQPIQKNGYHVFQNSSQRPNVPQGLESSQTQTSLQTQYHEARLTANAKAKSTAKGTGTPSSRRPWTTEEQAALMRGLDELGPHWSQILAQYGADGTVSNELKDRNQIQLKDKARNMKLFFLKQGKPVPDSLMQVTGELKTRAPTLASRQTSLQTDSPQSANHQTQAANSLAPHGGASTNHFPVTPAPLPEQAIASPPPPTMDAGLTGADADLEAALVAAERAALESS